MFLNGFDDTVMPVSHFPPDSIIEEFLMAQQPPGGWEQLATKRDLADLEVKTQAGFVELNASLIELSAKMDVQFAQLREQLAERFAAVDTRFADLSDKRSRDVWAFVVAIAVITVSICGSVFLAA